MTEKHTLQDPILGELKKADTGGYETDWLVDSQRVRVIILQENDLELFHQFHSTVHQLIADCQEYAATRLLASLNEELISRQQLPISATTLAAELSLESIVLSFGTYRFSFTKGAILPDCPITTVSGNRTQRISGAALEFIAEVTESLGQFIDGVAWLSFPDD